MIGVTNSTIAYCDKEKKMSLFRKKRKRTKEICGNRGHTVVEERRVSSTYYSTYVLIHKGFREKWENFKISHVGGIKL